MKRVALVAGHYPPSNLAAVHRARLWAAHLPEFGWEPIIVTTHHRHYEEALDWELSSLAPSAVRVIATAALPTRPVRVIGDIGIRAWPFHYRALARLAARREIDFIHITVPSFYSALLGRPLLRQHGVPYGIDYIDPWVHRWPGADRPFSKAAASAWLAERLEPWAVREARLITGVAEEYYRPMLDRNPHLRDRAVTAAMPYGASDRDFDVVKERSSPATLFDPADGNVHVVYAGAMLPHAYGVLDRLLEAVAQLRQRDPATRLRLHFIGTGTTPDDPRGFTVSPRAAARGLAEFVHEHPARVPYTTVLNHLVRASAVLVLGSTDRHYSPSKAYQAVQSGRPVLALLHEASTAATFLQQATTGPVVTFGEGMLPDAGRIAGALADLMAAAAAPGTPRLAGSAAIPEAYTARGSARALAAALDEAVSRAPGSP